MLGDINLRVIRQPERNTYCGEYDADTQEDSAYREEGTPRVIHNSRLAERLPYEHRCCPDTCKSDSVEGKDQPHDVAGDGPCSDVYVDPVRSEGEVEGGRRKHGAADDTVRIVREGNRR
jgi:hypothetical protein